MLSVSRKVEVFDSCRFSTLEKASRRIRDCSSIYCKESVELASNCCSRLWTDLKKDSWVLGLAAGGCMEEDGTLTDVVGELVAEGEGGDGVEEPAEEDDP